jgi:hypothetical protein
MLCDSLATVLHNRENVSRIIDPSCPPQFFIVQQESLEARYRMCRKKVIQHIISLVIDVRTSDNGLAVQLVSFLRHQLVPAQRLLPKKDTIQKHHYSKKILAVALGRVFAKRPRRHANDERLNKDRFHPNAPFLRARVFYNMQGKGLQYRTISYTITTQ